MVIETSFLFVSRLLSKISSKTVLHIAEFGNILVIFIRIKQKKFIIVLYKPKRVTYMVIIFQIKNVLNLNTRQLVNPKYSWSGSSVKVLQGQTASNFILITRPQINESL